MEWVNAHPEWKSKEVDPAGALKKAQDKWLEENGPVSGSISQRAEAAPVVAIGFWKIAFAVFIGNLMIGILGALVYFAVR